MELRLKWLTVICLSLFLTTIGHAKNENTPADIKFAIKKISLNKKIVTVEMAESDQQHERGLMLRKSLAKDHGMLFVFADENIRSFWMKNTIINLSIGYFDKNKKLIDVQEMKATSMMQKDLPSYPSRGPAMYALEMTEGWFDKNKVATGATFEFVK